MKKKIIIAVLAIISVLCCLLGLSACGGNGNNDDDGGGNQTGNDKHTHTYGSWAIIKEATCSEEGSRERTCTECNYIQTEIIEKKAHDFNNDNICKVCNYELEFTTGLEYVDYKQTEWPYSVGYMVTGLGTATNNDLVIPAYHAEKPVLKIADSAFSGKDALTSVYIANGISEIGEKAFEYCTSMQKVTLSNGKGLTIGANAFYGCKKLFEITMPNVSMSIGDKAFYSTAYYNDAKNWEDGVLFIGNHLITTNENFTATSYTIGDDIVTIADKAFYGRYNLIEFNILYKIHNNLRIGKSALLYSGIKKANFPYGYLDYLPATNMTELTVNSSETIYDLSEFVNLETLVVNGDWKDSSSSTGIEAPPLKGLGKLKNLTVKWLKGYYDSYYLGDLFGTTYYEGSIAVEQYIGEKNWQPVYKTCYIPANLKSVTVLSGKIPEYAFYNCNNIEIINLGKDVSKIMHYCIYGCSNLQSFNFTGSFEEFCTVVKDPGFNFTEKKKWIPLKVEGKVLQGKISVPESVSRIVDGAFYGQDSITEITIPDGVTSIGDYAFWLCDKLTSVTIYDSVTSIGSSAFGRCSSLQFNEYENGLYLGNRQNKYVVLVKTKNEDITSCTVNENTKVVYDSAFNYCSNLETVYWNATACTNTDADSGNAIFSNCPKLTSVIIGDKVTSIPAYAFSSCSGLTGITIPNNILSIGSSAFYDCSNLETVYWNATACTNTVADSDNAIFRNCPKLTSVIIGDNVTSIPAYAFSGCRSLTSVTIPDSVANIGEYAFEYCSLTSITIGNGVTAIGNYAFRFCNLTSVTIPDSIAEIGSCAFYCCSSLTSVTIGNGVTTIGSSAFDNCSSLTGITVSDGNKNYSSIDGILYDKEKTNIICVPKSIKGNIIIPNGVTAIGDSAFWGCSSLTSITIPDSVAAIGNDAFYGCSFTSIIIPDSVTTIGSSAFENCSSLTSVTIPDSVTAIGGSAFRSCIGLTSITIGNGVTSIAGCAFYGCKSLTSITIPDSIAAIGNDAFYGCKSLTGITIPDTVTTIGSSAFEDCSSLTSITISNGVTTIGSYAFYGCNSLTSVFYKGTPDDWNKIYIKLHNSKLESVTRYYYSETQPTASGNYWHYDENGNVVKW